MTAMLSTLRNPKIWLTALAAAAALSAACTDSGSLATSTSPDANAVNAVSSSGASVATVKAKEIQVFDSPDGGKATQKIAKETSFGSPSTFLVLGREGDRVQVGLSVRPNGSTGWIDADDVDVSTVDYAVHVDLKGNTLTVNKGDEVVLTTTTSDGSKKDPTPAGTFHVTDLLATGNDNGGYGPFAFGISAYSDTEKNFAGGDGQIGIHGTNEADKLGQDVSHGCIRVDNETISRMAEILPLGTPVFVA